MTYREYRPDSRLADYVECYWQSRGYVQEPETYNVLPDCCCDILINFGAPIHSDGETIPQHKAFIIGAATTFSTVSVQGNMSVCGIRFKPLGLPVFVQNLALGEVKDGVANIEDTGRFSFDRITGGIDELRLSLKGQLDHFLLSIFKPQHIPATQLNAVLQVVTAEKGLMSVRDIASFACTSPRTLERMFHRYVGLSPKEFARITRLRNIHYDLQRPGKMSMGELAFRYNYYDQAHFTKDFISYSGTAPTMSV